MSRGRSVAERSIRLLGRDAANLDSTTGQNGEVFFDTTNGSLRVYDGRTPGGSLLSPGFSIEEIQDLVGGMLASGVNHNNITVSYIDSAGKIQLTGFSGNYNDLSNKPNLFDGNYNNLTNKPTIPAGQVQVDWNAESGVSAILNKPTLFSGSYNDLTDLPTIPGEVNLTGYATESYVNTQISNVIGTAGAALDTLGELATALGNDASFATTITNSLAAKAPLANPTFTGTVSGITATMVGLGNVTNESKATMFTSPALTGTVTSAGNITFGDGFGIVIGAGTNGKVWYNANYNQFITDDGQTGCLFNSNQFIVKAGYTDAVRITSGTTYVDNNLEVAGLTTLAETTEVLNTKTGASGVVAHDFNTGAIWHHSTITANFTANFTNIPTTNNRTTVLTLILVQGPNAYLPNNVQIDGGLQTIKWLGGFEPTPNASQVDIVSFTLVRVANGWNVLGSLTTFG